MMVSVEELHGSRRFAQVATVTDRLHFRSAPGGTKKLSEWRRGPVQAFGLPSTAKRNLPRGICVGARAAMSGNTAGTASLILIALNRCNGVRRNAEAFRGRSHRPAPRYGRRPLARHHSALFHQGRKIVQEVTAHDARPIAARHSQGSPQIAMSLVLFLVPDQYFPAQAVSSSDAGLSGSLLSPARHTQCAALGTAANRACHSPPEQGPCRIAGLDAPSSPIVAVTIGQQTSSRRGAHFDKRQRLVAAPSAPAETGRSAAASSVWVVRRSIAVVRSAAARCATMAVSSAISDAAAWRSGLPLPRSRFGWRRGGGSSFEEGQDIGPLGHAPWEALVLRRDPRASSVAEPAMALGQASQFIRLITHPNRPPPRPGHRLGHSPPWRVPRQHCGLLLWLGCTTRAEAGPTGRRAQRCEGSLCWLHPNRRGGRRKGGYGVLPRDIGR